MASPALSSDEGEITEATSLPRSEQNGGVDRIGRNRGRHSRSPDDGASSRNTRNGASRRSRSPQGFKRTRDDRDRRDYTPRKHNGYYDDSRRGVRDRPRDWDRDRNLDDRPPSRGSHVDYDLPPSRSTNMLPYSQDDSRSRGRFDDSRSGRDYDRRHGGYPEKRTRNRTRSPPSQRGRDKGRHNSGRHGRDRRADQDKYSAQDRSSHRDDNSKRVKFEASSDTGKEKAKADQGDVANDGNKPSDSAASKTTQDEDMDYNWEPTPKEDDDAEIERRRLARQAILARARGAGTPNIQSLQVSDQSGSTPASTRFNTPDRNAQKTEMNTPRSASAGSPAMSPAPAQEVLNAAAFTIADDQDLINTHAKAKVEDEDGPSAADYDPTVDMQEDERRDEMKQRQAELEMNGHRPPEQAAVVIASVEAEEPEKETGDDDDDFDMFADDFDEAKFAAAAKPAVAKVDQLAQVNGGGGGILEGDDQDGYYKIRPGEILDGRYQISTTLGRGMFSGVARAVDITNQRVVAVKIMRNNDALKKGGYTEIAILQKLNDADPDNKKHLVKFERAFEYKGHLCMIFENLSLNLREVLKKFGNNIGINLNATRAYAYQIFIALSHMRKCSIIHADLKPDNILVNETRNVLKICDLGTAIDRSDAATASTEITPYLVSRYYRAPEIILGMPYDYAIDVWSIGCTLYELYTGKILFTGDSNNQMLKNIMEIRGKFSPKLYRRGQLAAVHFDEQGNFVSVERDKLLGKAAVRTLPMVKPKRDLRTRLMAASSGMDDAETRELNHFVDLLERCLTLNPDKRILPSEALRHPFFTHKMHGAAK